MMRVWGDVTDVDCPKLPRVSHHNTTIRSIKHFVPAVESTPLYRRNRES